MRIAVEVLFTPDFAHIIQQGRTAEKKMSARFAVNLVLGTSFLAAEWSARTG